MREKYLVVAMLYASDRNRYTKLIDNIENAWTFGQDKYPKTITTTYNLLTDYHVS